MNLSTRCALAALALPSLLSAQRMFVVDSSRVVSELDLVTATRTQVGTLPTLVGTSAGFAYDFSRGRLYVSSTGNDSIYLVDTTNWNAKLIGNYGVGSSVVMHGLEWDALNDQLYAASTDGSFYTVDRLTGAATLVGNTGLTSFHNLGYDLLRNTMFLTNSNTDSYYTIDRATGAVTLIAPLVGSTNPNSLAFRFDTDTMYMADNSTDTLYTLDPVTGTNTVVGSMGASNVLGMAWIPGTGRLVRTVHACGGIGLFVTGSPNLGGQVDFEVENTTGIPVIGVGVTQLNLPFCGCTIGHDYIGSAVTSTLSLQVPTSASIVGSTVYIQGVDYLGTTGCADPQVAFSDTIALTVGS